MPKILPFRDPIRPSCPDHPLAYFWRSFEEEDWHCVGCNPHTKEDMPVQVTSGKATRMTKPGQGATIGLKDEPPP